MSTQPIAKCDEHASWLKRLVPALDWLAHYERKHLPGDALAGVIVAALIIPQGMAYALLAGLPPQFGLARSWTGSPARSSSRSSALNTSFFRPRQPTKSSPVPDSPASDSTETKP